MNKVGHKIITKKKSYIKRDKFYELYFQKINPFYEKNFVKFIFHTRPYNNKKVFERSKRKSKIKLDDIFTSLFKSRQSQIARKTIYQQKRKA